MNRDSDWTAVQTVLFFRNQLTNVVSQKFIRKNSKPWHPLKQHSNPPLSPFFKGGILSVGL